MSKFFINRPIVAIVISILTVIVGVITIVSLPVSQFPAIAQSQLDTEIQAKLGTQALVLAAKANVEQAELNMEWTKVTSLINGIAGIAQVQIGNLVGPASVLTSVSQVDPIKA